MARTIDICEIVRVNARSKVYVQSIVQAPQLGSMRSEEDVCGAGCFNCCSNVASDEK